MPGDYQVLEQRLQYRFRDMTLLETALTHSSFIHEKPDAGHSDNERLEFLGDAVLDLAIGHLLMDHYPRGTEGELSKARAGIVSEQGLAEVAGELGLGQWLFLGRGEQQTGGRNKASLLADACEAVIAAVYLDGGFEAALRVVELLFSKRLRSVEANATEDHKTLLQEIVQGSLRTVPRYTLLSEQGPDHEKTFEVAVMVAERQVAVGSGRSKKEAEQRAAKQAIETLKGEGDAG